MPAVTPTARSAAILAGLSLLLLFLPVGIPVAGALALVACGGVDAWVVRRPVPVDRTVSPLLSRGVPSPLRVRAMRGDGRRLLLRQPATSALTVAGGTGVGGLDGSLVARRRGRHQLPALATASVGPLGLARVSHPPGAAMTVRVYPDLVAARALIARLRRDLATHPGRLARGPLGLGTDFESVRDYTPDDDVRQLNWRATARLGRPMSNQYRLERDRDLVCLVDVGRLMSAPVQSRTMLDAALDAVSLLALAADQLGDRCGVIAFDETIRRAVTPGRLSGRRVVEAIFDLETRPVDSDFERAFMAVGRSRRALVMVFTDLIDEAAARSLSDAIPMLARRHAVAVAGVADPALSDAVLTAPASALAAARALVAEDVLQARAGAAARLRRGGASVIEASASQLAARCLDAYLDAKSRGRM